MKATSDINVITVSEKIHPKSDQGLVNSPSTQLICQRTQEANTSSLFQTISALNPAACLGLARRTVTNPAGGLFGLGCRNATVQKAREARRRSEAIDLQIRQDSKLRNNRAQLVLLSAGFGSRHEEKRLILDSMARWSKSIRDTDSSCVGSKLPSEGQVVLVRDTLLRLLREIVGNVWSHFGGLDVDETGPVKSDSTGGWEYPRWTTMLQACEEIQSTLGKEGVGFQEVAQAIDKLWKTEAWQWECYHRVGRSKAFDDKILEIIRRAGAPDYTPSSADLYFITYCHRSFNGETYEVGQEKFVEVVDLNNLWQRLPMSKRKTTWGWFSDATCILCPIDLASYTWRCPLSMENSLNDAIFFAQEYLRKNYAPHASVLLLFGNLDALKRKLKTWPFEKYFSDYKPVPGMDPADSVLKYVTDKILSANKPKDPDLAKKVYIHVGEPDDRKTFDFIISRIRQTRLDKQLSDVGVMKRME
ncbi:hypothetical protein QBC38DRAFT_488623 [Podospora fimiseda]|uniref:Uncharacterized protein n=1 Tax=Podospora fimiseda TaxID=252190 RepID=A0AAN6YRZ1_9PEZI|nr:hypothetical protein QBC38DRAFT_488623 [Podospora fimiseda]